MSWWPCFIHRWTVYLAEVWREPASLYFNIKSSSRLHSSIATAISFWHTLPCNTLQKTVPRSRASLMLSFQNTEPFQVSSTTKLHSCKELKSAGGIFLPYLSTFSRGFWDTLMGLGVCLGGHCLRCIPKSHRKFALKFHRWKVKPKTRTLGLQHWQMGSA